MTQLPSIELLEKTHEFPCDFVFKIIADVVETHGETSPELRQKLILDLASEALDQDISKSLTYKISSKGNHVAYTLIVRCQKPEDVHSVYLKIMTLSHLRAVM